MSTTHTNGTTAFHASRMNLAGFYAEANDGVIVRFEGDLIPRDGSVDAATARLSYRAGRDAARDA